MDTNWINRKLGFLPRPLREAIVAEASMQTFPPGTALLRAGAYVRVIPLVQQGLIKVSSPFEERDLLLYYIQPEESCIMSLASVLQDTPSQIDAVTEEETTALLLPAAPMREWLRQYPSLNRLFYDQYNKRYNDLLQTIHQLLFNRMDQRLLDHLREKARLRGQQRLQLSHRQIAEELGTAREVVSRVMKKLEQDGAVRQIGQGVIEITNL